MGEIENAISGGALFASYSDTLAAGLLVVQGLPGIQSPSQSVSGNDRGAGFDA